MSDRPNGWALITLDEVAADHSTSFVDGPFGSNLKSSEYTDEGVRLIQLQNIGEGNWINDNQKYISQGKAKELNRHIAVPGDIAVAKMAAPVARACLLPAVSERFVVVADCIKLQPDLERHDPRYLVYAINHHHVRQQAERKSTGTTRKRINLSTLKTVNIWSPPLAQQRWIADILDTADAAIQQTEAVIAKLKQVKAGLLHDLLTRGLDGNGQLRDPEAHPEQFKETEIGRVPRGWEVARLLDRISLPHGQVDPRQEPYRDWPLIAPNHIESGTGRLLETATAAEQGAISGKYPFEPGDVVYSKIRPYLRKAILAESEGLSSADMYPLQAGPNIVPRFLLALILAEEFSRFAESVSMRSGIPKINRDELGEFETAFPSLEKQKRIASILEAHDERILAEEAYRDKLQQVKRGLMQDLLTGRVRVDGQH